MEREDFDTIRFDAPATLLCAIEHGEAASQETSYHFGRLGDALREWRDCQAQLAAPGHTIVGRARITQENCVAFC